MTSGPPDADRVFGRRGTPPPIGNKKPSPAADNPTEFVVPALNLRRDPTQPRRAVPPSLNWNGDPHDAGAMFSLWVERIAGELGRGPRLLYEQYKQTVKGEIGIDDFADDQRPPLERHFLALLDLAASLLKDKQINSIVVVKRDDGLWQIENGERRWLASMLLVFLLEDTQYINVRVRVESEFNRFRQGAENIARADLNMVARARQFALYLMELVKEQGMARITPYEYCETDHAYYAQVAEVNVPDGQLQRLLNALGVKSKASISQYRTVLALPADQWLIADEQDWTRGQIDAWFTVVNQPIKHEKTTRKKDTPKKSKKTPTEQKWTAFKSQFERDFKRPEKRAVLAEELDALERWIQQIRAQLDP